MSISAYGNSTGGKNPLKGTGYKNIQTPNFTPEMMQLFQSLFGQLGPDSYLGKLAGGDEATFNQIEAPALKQFAGIQGNLASRFSGMGSGARHSSGHQLAQTSAAQDFAGQLQSRRHELSSQAMRDLMSMSQMLLGQRPHENNIVEEQTPWWQEFLTSLGGGIGQAGAQFGGLGAAKKFGLLG